MKFRPKNNNGKSKQVLSHGNAYLRMVNIDYTAIFICPDCRDNPDVIILDGLTLGQVEKFQELTSIKMKINKISQYHYQKVYF